MMPTPVVHEDDPSAPHRSWHLATPGDPLGLQHLGQDGLRQVQAWARDLDVDVARDLDATTLVVGPFRVSFGLAPEENLERIGTVVDLAASIGAERVVWLLDQDPPGALSQVEGRAAFGAYVSLDLLAVTDGDQPVKLAAGGPLRRSVLTGTIALQDVRTSKRVLRDLHRAATAEVILLLSEEVATSLSRSPLQRRRVKESCTRGAVLGALVGEHERDAAVAVMARLVRLLRERFNQEAGVVRFTGLDVVAHSPSVVRACSAAGVVLDLSLRHDPDDGADAYSRMTAYQPVGAYHPMAFDLRVPAAARGVELTEVVTVDPPHAPDGLADWTSRVLRDDAPRRLAPLLDFPRKEAFFQRVASDRSLWRSYHQHLVHNWPAPPPRIRAVALDIAADDSILDTVERLRSALPATAQMVPGHAFVTHARAEADMRLGGSVASLLDQQRDQHGYLDVLALDAPLREDLEAFASFIPPRLGTCMELGGAPGQLARHLASRADVYVVVDLVTEQLQGLDPARAELAVVGDAHHLPFADGTFETVVANNVLEHLYDPVAALRSLRRVLRPHGALYALIPLDALQPRHASDAHVWKVDLTSLELACAQAGLVVTRAAVLDLGELGVEGAFPSCRGRVVQAELRGDDGRGPHHSG